MVDIEVMEPNERLRALFAKGEQVDIVESVPIRRYFRSCQEIIRMAGVYYEERNYENSYILYAKFIVLSLEKLKNHPDYSKVPVEERQGNKRGLKTAFDRAEKLKPIIKKKYEDAFRRYEEKQARLVALEIEKDKLRKEEEQRRQEQEQNEMLKVEKEQMDAFIRQQELIELEKERRQIEAEFGEKATLQPSAPLIPTDFAPPPVFSVTHPYSPLSPGQSLAAPALPPASSLQTQQIVPKPSPSHEVGMRPSFDRALKPKSSESEPPYEIATSTSGKIHTTTAFAASLTKSQNQYGLRTVMSPRDLPDKFLRLVDENTRRNIETCGVLFGKLANEAFLITHVLIPHQRGAPDSCDTTREEDMWDFQDQYHGICLGWIHTHPSQTAFLSSVDLHTHYPYQCLMPESVAIVCSAKFSEIGYFMLTPKYGMKEIGSCRKVGFHPHTTNPPLFEACDHVKLTSDAGVQIVDWRDK